MANETKPPAVHKMDSDPDFLSSMEYVKTVLKPKFKEQAEKRRAEKEQQDRLEKERLEKLAQELKQKLPQPTEPVVCVRVEPTPVKAAETPLGQPTKKKRGPYKSREEKLGHPRTYGVLVHYSGVVEVVTSLDSFLLKHGYSKREKTTVLGVLQGKAYYFKGWTLVGGPVEKLTRAELMAYLAKEKA